MLNNIIYVSGKMNSFVRSSNKYLFINLSNMDNGSLHILIFSSLFKVFITIFIERKK